MVPLGVALASLRRRSLAPGLHPDGEPAALQVTGVGSPATLTAPPPLHRRWLHCCGPAGPSLLCRGLLWSVPHLHLLPDGLTIVWCRDVSVLETSHLRNILFPAGQQEVGVGGPSPPCLSAVPGSLAGILRLPSPGTPRLFRSGGLALLPFLPVVEELCMCCVSAVSLDCVESRLLVHVGLCVRVVSDGLWCPGSGVPGCRPSRRAS